MSKKIFHLFKINNTKILDLFIDYIFFFIINCAIILLIKFFMEKFWEKSSEKTLPSSEWIINKINSDNSPLSLKTILVIQKLFTTLWMLKKSNKSLSVLEDIVANDHGWLPESYKSISEKSTISDKVEILILYILERKISIIEKENGEIDINLKMQILTDKLFLKLDKYNEWFESECEVQLTNTNRELNKIIK